jgi:hypothetical protein
MARNSDAPSAGKLDRRGKFFPRIRSEHFIRSDFVEALWFRGGQN